MNLKIKSLSIILPCYNEAENISLTIKEILHFVNKSELIYEIIIVNDGSTDKSKKILHDISRKNKKIIVVHHDVNKGYGAALKTGFQNASYDWLFLQILMDNLT